MYIREERERENSRNLRGILGSFFLRRRRFSHLGYLQRIKIKNKTRKNERGQRKTKSVEPQRVNRIGIEIKGWEIAENKTEGSAACYSVRYRHNTPNQNPFLSSSTLQRTIVNQTLLYLFPQKRRKN
jgi:hypothetical protein